MLPTEKLCMVTKTFLNNREVFSLSQNKTWKSVSFNKTKEEDVKRLKHIARKNFSKYIKKLIDEDIEKKVKQNQSENKTPDISTIKKAKNEPAPTKQLSIAEKLELQKQKLNQAISPAPFIKKQFRED